MDLGKRFKYYRSRMHLTQKEAAEQIGINDYQLGNYETNRSEPSISILKKMSKVYGVSIDTLVGNSVLHNKYENENQNDNQKYVDVNEILKDLTEYVNQQNKKQ